MMYLVTAEFIENSVTPEAFPQVWENVIRPSLETLAKMADEKKLTGNRQHSRLITGFCQVLVGSTQFWSKIVG